MKTHGMSGNYTYKSWGMMKSRCTNPSYNHYHNYGGRGIKVCDRWLESFENFLEDMGERPKNHSLDRIDVDGDYCKENCRWSTSKEQNNNRRNNHIIEFNGKSQNITAWAEELNIKVDILSRRILRGWSIEDTLSIPPINKKDKRINRTTNDYYSRKKTNA